MPTIQIQDEVNVRVTGLGITVDEEVQKELSYYVPNFRFTPKYKMGWWDGKIKLFSKTGKTFYHLLDDVLDILDQYDITDIQIEDNRRDISDWLDRIEYPDENLFSDYQIDGEPVILRDYQLDAVHTALKEGCGMLEMATNAGKTLTCAAISKVYSSFGNVVVIVPNIDLAVQTQHKFKQVGLETGLWYGEVHDRKTITISTWQSLADYPEMFSNVSCCIVDEAHQAKAKTIFEIMTGPAANVPFRFGCTGSVPKERIYRQQIKAALGPTIFELTSWELQQMGVSAESEIYQVIMKDSRNPDYVDFNKKFEDGRVDEWKAQIDWFFQNPERLSKMAEIIESVSEEDDNTIVFVYYRAHGEALKKYIEHAYYMDGRTKNREDYYEKLRQTTGNCLITTVKLASTGLDIPNINNIVVIEPGKKFETIIQVIGRGLRRSETKSTLRMFDICSDSDFSSKHRSDRLRTYKGAKHQVEILEIDYYADS